MKLAVHIAYYNDIEDLKYFADKSADEIVKHYNENYGAICSVDKGNVFAVEDFDKDAIQLTTDGKYLVQIDLPNDLKLLGEENVCQFYIDIYKVEEVDDDTNEDGEPMTIKAMKNCISVIRKDTESHIRKLLENYNIKELYCTEYGDCPIVLPSADGDGSESYTLDRVEINDKNYGVIFHCSNCYDNDFVMVSDVPIEELIDILEWLETNIEDLIDE